MATLKRLMEFYFTGNKGTFFLTNKKNIAPFRLSGFLESGKIFRKIEVLPIIK